MRPIDLARQLYREALRTDGIPDDEQGRKNSFNDLYRASEILLRHVNVVRIVHDDEETDISDGAQADSR